MRLLMSLAVVLALAGQSQAGPIRSFFAAVFGGCGTSRVSPSFEESPYSPVYRGTPVAQAPRPPQAPPVVGVVASYATTGTCANGQCQPARVIRWR